MHLINNNTEDSPNWIKALASQSWQVELIASGLAIYGALALGDYLQKVVEYFVYIFSDRILAKMNFVVMYLYIAQYFIVASFIAHLALRIVWVGYLGLSSVYPKGINTEKKTVYTSSFLQKVKNEFPDLSDYSLKLDNLCSLVFSVLSTIVLFILVFTLWICIFIVLYELLYFAFNPIWVNTIIFTLLGLVVLFLFGFSLIANGKYKNTQFAEKYSYKLNRIVAKTIMLFAYQPINYVLWTFRTNMKGGKLIAMVLLLTMPVSILVGFTQAQTLSMFKSDQYFELNALAADAKPANYLDQRNDGRILHPVIQSKEISEDHIVLFLPRLKRDRVFMEKLCGEFEEVDGLSRIEEKKQYSQFKVNCAQKYYFVSIDNNDVTGVHYSFVRHQNMGEKGFEVFIPIDSLKNGYHELIIQTGYENEEGEKAVRVIPFYKEAN